MQHAAGVHESHHKERVPRIAAIVQNLFRDFELNPTLKDFDEQSAVLFVQLFPLLKK